MYSIFMGYVIRLYVLTCVCANCKVPRSLFSILFASHSFLYYTKLKNRFSSGRFFASALADSKLQNKKKNGKEKSIAAKEKEKKENNAHTHTHPLPPKYKKRVNT